MQTVKLSATWPFQALGDETRFRVMRLLVLSGVPLRAGQLAAIVELPPNYLSKHLQILEVAGLTTTIRRGKVHYIGINSDRHSNEPLYKAILSMDDDKGTLSEDAERLCHILEVAGGG